MSLSSNNNAILFNSCKSLQSLIVTLQANWDLITQGNNGFSLQLNCYPQTNPQAKYQGKALEWMQFVMAVENNSVQWGIQYWSVDKGFGFSPSNNYSSFASASSNQVPRGAAMRIALATDSSSNVKSATFSITNAAFNNVSSYTFDFPSNCLCAIYGFQVNLVGPPSGTHSCKFVSGGGVITYQALDSLAVQSSNTCGGPQIITGETSNATYGGVTPAAWDVSQTVGF
ncbi:MAG: hypothetical protein WCB01_16215 [Candidatus Cybelea sp.]